MQYPHQNPRPKPPTLHITHIVFVESSSRGCRQVTVYRGARHGAKICKHLNPETLAGASFNAFDDRTARRSNVNKWIRVQKLKNKNPLSILTVALRQTMNKSI